jgi:hypothetical protein
MVHHLQSLTQLEGKALIISLFVLHGLLVDVFRYTTPTAY